MANKIIKTFSSTSKALGSDTYEVMISTESIDRDGEIVRAAGAKLENYKRNPVVLWGHDYRLPPVAKALKVEVLPGRGLKATFKFPSKGASDLADQVHALWDEGFLSATSIGFMPLKSINLDPQKPWGPQEYTEWELLEYSIVNVPAQPDALRLAFQGQKNQALDVAQSILRIAAQRKDQKLFLKGLEMYFLTLSKRI